MIGKVIHTFLIMGIILVFGVLILGAIINRKLKAL